MENKGENGITKRKKMIDIFRKGKFEVLVLAKKKVKGQILLSRGSGICAAVQENERNKEGEAFLLNGA